MNAGLDAGLLASSGHPGMALHAGILLMQHELSSVRYGMDVMMFCRPFIMEQSEEP